MKLRYPRWLKRLVLPFEDPSHPLYTDPAKTQEIQRWENLSPEEQEAEMEARELEAEENLRQVFGEGFVQQWRRVLGKD